MFKCIIIHVQRGNKESFGIKNTLDLTYWSKNMFVEASSMIQWSSAS